MSTVALMRPIILVGATLLASCGQKVVEVRIPATVGCVKPSDIPAIPAPVGKQLTGNAAQDITPISISALELRAALNTAVALLNGCVIEEPQ